MLHSKSVICEMKITDSKYFLLISSICIVLIPNLHINLCIDAHFSVQLQFYELDSLRK
jgi:hypothetical protein